VHDVDECLYVWGACEGKKHLPTGEERSSTFGQPLPEREELFWFTSLQGRFSAVPALVPALVPGVLSRECSIQGVLYPGGVVAREERYTRSRRLAPWPTLQAATGDYPLTSCNRSVTLVT